MTQSAMHKLEEKLTRFRSTLKAGQWLDADLLLTRVDQLKLTDLALARRVLQRVRILRPDDKDIVRRMNELNKKLTISQPELVSSSSKEVAPSDTSMPTSVEVAKPSNPYEKVKTAFLSLQLSQFKTPFMFLVVLPVICFAFYQIVWASPRFESQTQIIVKQPDGMATLDPQMAALAGFGMGGGGGSDTELLKAYIYSNDMYRHLEDKLKVSEHFSSWDYDFFSRLSGSASIEDKLEYYKTRLTVEIDEKSSIVSIYVQAYDPNIALALTQTIADRAEWYINDIGHKLAKSQLEFVQQEHQLVEQNLQQKKNELLAFQRRYNLLNPEAEGLAIQQITYELESLIATKKTELRALSNSMSDDAPLVMQANEQLKSLNAQLKDERQRLTQKANTTNASAENEASYGVGEIMARFSDYKINMEFALQAYASSQVSLEKSRIEAYRQLKFLMVVETPTLAEDARYPRVTYNVALLSTALLLLFGIGKIIYATVEELR
jgi:capsular polysaccharide transport system permease protein